MNNAQKFIAGEFSQHEKYADKSYKPSLVINSCDNKGEGIRTCYLGITWEQFEHIKQYLIDSEKGE